MEVWSTTSSVLVFAFNVALLAIPLVGVGAFGSLVIKWWVWARPGVDEPTDALVVEVAKHSKYTAEQVSAFITTSGDRVVAAISSAMDQQRK